MQHWNEFGIATSLLCQRGVMPEDLSEEVRELALDVLRATLSVRGFEQERSIMAINELIDSYRVSTTAGF